MRIRSSPRLGGSTITDRAYQGAAYEGLTVAFLEIAFANGGRVLTDDAIRTAHEGIDRALETF